MTKKDYELIAKVFNLCGAQNLQWENHSGFPDDKNLVEAMATELAKDNPRFDRDKFLKACGIIGENTKKQVNDGWSSTTTKANTVTKY